MLRSWNSNSDAFGSGTRMPDALLPPLTGGASEARGAEGGLRSWHLFCLCSDKATTRGAGSCWRQKGHLPLGGASSSLWASPPSPAGPGAHQPAGAQLWSPAPDLVPATASWPGSSGRAPVEGSHGSRLARLRRLGPSTRRWLGGRGPRCPRGWLLWGPGLGLGPLRLPRWLLGPRARAVSEMLSVLPEPAHHVGQAQVAHDGREDAHAGCDEVAQGRGLGVHATCEETPAAAGRWLVPLPSLTSGSPPGLCHAAHNTRGSPVRAPAQPSPLSLSLSCLFVFLNIDIFY